MFYEEKLINGVLHCRSEPDGEWRLVDSVRAAAVSMLLGMGEEQRLDVMRFFCGHCGIVQPDGRACQCWNDE